MYIVCVIGNGLTRVENCKDDAEVHRLLATVDNRSYIRLSVSCGRQPILTVVRQRLGVVARLSRHTTKGR